MIHRRRCSFIPNLLAAPSPSWRRGHITQTPSPLQQATNRSPTRPSSAPPPKRESTSVMRRKRSRGAAHAQLPCAMVKIGQYECFSVPSGGSWSKQADMRCLHDPKQGDLVQKRAYRTAGDRVKTHIAVFRPASVIAVAADKLTSSCTDSPAPTYRPTPREKRTGVLKPDPIGHISAELANEQQPQLTQTTARIEPRGHIVPIVIASERRPRAPPSR